MKDWHCDLLRESKAKKMYFAYDTPDDYEPLVKAGEMLRNAGITAKSHAASCYVLIGHKGDSFEKAEERLKKTIKAGFFPYAMLYRDESGSVDQEWKKFQREWLRPQIVGTKFREIWRNDQ